jgi:hypothetical protein
MLMNAGGAIVGLIVIAWIALAILFPPAKVRALVSQQLSRTLTRDVRFDNASLGLFPPVRLTVSNPALAEAGGFARGTAFQASSIHLDLDVFALLARRVLVRRLVLDQPAIHLVLRPDGTTNFDNLMKTPPPAGGAPGKPTPGMDVLIQELVIQHGQLLVDDVKADARRSITIDSRIALSAEQGGNRIGTSGSTTLTNFAFGTLGTARIADLNQSLAKLETRIDHRGTFDVAQKRLALERLDVGLGKTKLGVSGTVDDVGPEARLDLKAKGSNIDFGDVLGYVAAADAKAVHGISGSGRMDFDLGIRGGVGPAASKTVTGTLGVKNAAFRYPGAPAGVDALNFTTQFAPDSLGIGDLTARVSGQPVSATLSMTRFADPLVAFTVHGNVDLAAVGPLVAPKDVKLAGHAVVNASGRGRAKDAAAMAVSGGALLQDVSVESPQLPRKVDSVNGALTFSQTHATVKDLTAKAGQSSFTLNADVVRPLALMAKPGSTPPAELTFDFRSPHLDLAELLPPASGPAVVPNAVGHGTVSIARLKNQKLDVSQVQANVLLEPGIVRAPQFSMHAYNGVVSGDARMDLRDPANPGLTLKAKVDSISADALLSTWTPAKSLLQGSLNTSLDFSVAGATQAQMLKTLTAVGVAEMLKGQIGPGPVLAEIAKTVNVPALDRLKFNAATLPFRVEQGQVVSDAATLRGSYGEWKVAGAVGFDGALDYAVSATLPQSIVKQLNASSAAGVLTDGNGNLLVDLKVGGTARSPRVSIDTKAMGDRLAGKASQALTDQRHKMEDQLKAALRARDQATTDSARREADKHLESTIRDSIGRKAQDIFKNLFGKPKKPAPPPSAPPASAPPASPPPAPTPAPTDSGHP